MFFNSATLHAYTLLSAIISDCQFLLRQTCHRKLEQPDQAAVPPGTSYLNTWLQVPTSKVYALPFIQPVLHLRRIPLCYIIHLTFILSAVVYLFHSPRYLLLLGKNTMGWWRNPFEWRNQDNWETEDVGFFTQQVIIWQGDKQHDSLYFNMNGTYGTLEQQSSPTCEWCHSD
jgi:hypothetical protein